MLKKYEIRIPTTQYGYINMVIEGGEIDEVIEEHNKAVKLYAISQSDNPGLSVKDWARIRRTLLNEGKYDLEDFEMMNKLQRWWIKETEKTIKDIK